MLLFNKEVLDMLFSTDEFHWNSMDGSFTQELSSLKIRPDQTPFHRVRHEAPVDGIALVSHVTGQAAYYFIDKIDKNHHKNEIYGWHLLPTSETIKAIPRLKNTKVLIIND